MRAKLLGLGGGGNRQAASAAAKRCGGARRSTVAVAVCLHHRAELGRVTDPCFQRLAVSLDGPGVDHGQGPACPLAVAQSASPAGIESITSPAITESSPIRSPAARPARECATTAAQVPA